MTYGYMQFQIKQGKTLMKLQLLALLQDSVSQPRVRGLK